MTTATTKSASLSTRSRTATNNNINNRSSRSNARFYINNHSFEVHGVAVTPTFLQQQQQHGNRRQKLIELDRGHTSCVSHQTSSDDETNTDQQQQRLLDRNVNEAAANTDKKPIATKRHNDKKIELKFKPCPFTAQICGLLDPDLRKIREKTETPTDLKQFLIKHHNQRPPRHAIKRAPMIDADKIYEEFFDSHYKILKETIGEK